MADRPRFKVDESLPDEAARILSEAGYDAVTIGVQKLNGAPDARLADVHPARTLASLAQKWRAPARVPYILKHVRVGPSEGCG